MATMKNSSINLADYFPPYVPDETTFVFIKSEAVRQGYTGAILQRFIDKGFRLDRVQKLQPTLEVMSLHYGQFMNRDFFNDLISAMIDGPIVTMSVFGPNAIIAVREMLGEVGKPGTLRGDFGTTFRQNAVHASDGPESAKMELNLWFGMKNSNTSTNNILFLRAMEPVDYGELMNLPFEDISFVDSTLLDDEITQQILNDSSVQGILDENAQDINVSVEPQTPPTNKRPSLGQSLRSTIAAKTPEKPPEKRSKTRKISPNNNNVAPVAAPTPEQVPVTETTEVFSSVPHTTEFARHVVLTLETHLDPLFSRLAQGRAFMKNIVNQTRADYNTIKSETLAIHKLLRDIFMTLDYYFLRFSLTPLFNVPGHVAEEQDQEKSKKKAWALLNQLGTHSNVESALLALIRTLKTDPMPVRFVPIITLQGIFKSIGANVQELLGHEQNQPYNVYKRKIEAMAMQNVMVNFIMLMHLQTKVYFMVRGEELVKFEIETRKKFNTLETNTAISVSSQVDMRYGGKLSNLMLELEAKTFVKLDRKRSTWPVGIASNPISAIASIVEHLVENSHVYSFNTGLFMNVPFVSPITKEYLAPIYKQGFTIVGHEIPAYIMTAMARRTGREHVVGTFISCLSMIMFAQSDENRVRTEKAFTLETMQTGPEYERELMSMGWFMPITTDRHSKNVRNILNKATPMGILSKTISVENLFLYLDSQDDNKTFNLTKLSSMFNRVLKLEEV